MKKSSLKKERIDLLADVAELYYIKGQNQAEIGYKLGVTRSMVSRMLTESREIGLVKVSIVRPINLHQELAEKLQKRFDLEDAVVVETGNSHSPLPLIGKVASQLLIHYLKPGMIVGTTWGSTISAMVDEIELPTPIADVNIVQLLGATGNRVKEYDGQAIVRRLESRIGAEGIYLNAPFLVENELTAKSLIENSSLHETLSLAARASIAILGIGSTDPTSSPYFLAGYISKADLQGLLDSGAKGDVCGIFFDKNGNITNPELQRRVIGIRPSQLKAIPIRLGIAGGIEKAVPILGALRGGFINILATDARTAQAILAII